MPSERLKLASEARSPSGYYNTWVQGDYFYLAFFLICFVATFSAWLHQRSSCKRTNDKRPPIMGSDKKSRGKVKFVPAASTSASKSDAAASEEPVTEQTKLQGVVAEYIGGRKKLMKDVDKLIQDKAYPNKNLAHYAKARMLYHDMGTTLKHDPNGREAVLKDISQLFVPADTMLAALQMVWPFSPSEHDPARSLLGMCLLLQMFEDEKEYTNVRVTISQVEKRSVEFWTDPASEAMDAKLDPKVPRKEWEQVVGENRDQRVGHKLQFIYKVKRELDKREAQARKEAHERFAHHQDKKNAAAEQRAAARNSTSKGTRTGPSSGRQLKDSDLVPVPAADGDVDEGVTMFVIDPAAAKKERKAQKDEKERLQRAGKSYELISRFVQHKLAHISFEEPEKRVEGLRQLTQISMVDAERMIRESLTTSIEDKQLAKVYVAALPAALKLYRDSNTVLQHSPYQTAPASFVTFAELQRHVSTAPLKVESNQLEALKGYQPLRAHMPTAPRLDQVFSGDLAEYLEQGVSCRLPGGGDGPDDADALGDADGDPPLCDVVFQDLLLGYPAMVDAKLSAAEAPGCQEPGPSDACKDRFIQAITHPNLLLLEEETMVGLDSQVYESGGRRSSSEADTLEIAVSEKFNKRSDVLGYIALLVHRGVLPLASEPSPDPLLNLLHGILMEGSHSIVEWREFKQLRASRLWDVVRGTSSMMEAPSVALQQQQQQHRRRQGPGEDAAADPAKTLSSARASGDIADSGVTSGAAVADSSAAQAPPARGNGGRTARAAADPAEAGRGVSDSSSSDDELCVPLLSRECDTPQAEAAAATATEAADDRSTSLTCSGAFDAASDYRRQLEADCADLLRLTWRWGMATQALRRTLAVTFAELGAPPLCSLQTSEEAFINALPLLEGIQRLRAVRTLLLVHAGWRFWTCDAAPPLLDKVRFVQHLQGVFSAEFVPPASSAAVGGGTCAGADGTGGTDPAGAHGSGTTEAAGGTGNSSAALAHKGVGDDAASVGDKRGAGRTAIRSGGASGCGGDGGGGRGDCSLRLCGDFYARVCTSVEVHRCGGFDAQLGFISIPASPSIEDWIRFKTKPLPAVVVPGSQLGEAAILSHLSGNFCNLQYAHLPAAEAETWVSLVQHAAVVVAQLGRIQRAVRKAQASHVQGLKAALRQLSLLQLQPLPSRTAAGLHKTYQCAQQAVLKEDPAALSSSERAALVRDDAASLSRWPKHTQELLSHCAMGTWAMSRLVEIHLDDYKAMLEAQAAERRSAAGPLADETNDSTLDDLRLMVKCTRAKAFKFGEQARDEMRIVEDRVQLAAKRYNFRLVNPTDAPSLAAGTLSEADLTLRSSRPITVMPADLAVFLHWADKQAAQALSAAFLLQYHLECLCDLLVLRAKRVIVDRLLSEDVVSGPLTVVNANMTFVWQKWLTDQALEHVKEELLKEDAVQPPPDVAKNPTKGSNAKKGKATSSKARGVVANKQVWQSSGLSDDEQQQGDAKGSPQDGTRGASVDAALSPQSGGDGGAGSAAGQADAAAATATGVTSNGATAAAGGASVVRGEAAAGGGSRNAAGSSRGATAASQGAATASTAAAAGTLARPARGAAAPDAQANSSSAAAADGWKDQGRRDNSRRDGAAAGVGQNAAAAAGQGNVRRSVGSGGTNILSDRPVGSATGGTRGSQRIVEGGGGVDSTRSQQGGRANSGSILRDGPSGAAGQGGIIGGVAVGQNGSSGGRGGPANGVRPGGTSGSSSAGVAAQQRSGTGNAPPPAGGKPGSPASSTPSPQLMGAWAGGRPIVPPPQPSSPAAAAAAAASKGGPSPSGGGTDLSQLAGQGGGTQDGSWQQAEQQGGWQRGARGGSPTGWDAGVTEGWAPENGPAGGAGGAHSNWLVEPQAVVQGRPIVRDGQRPSHEGSHGQDFQHHQQQFQPGPSQMYPDGASTFYNTGDPMFGGGINSGGLPVYPPGSSMTYPAHGQPVMLPQMELQYDQQYQHQQYQQQQYQQQQQQYSTQQYSQQWPGVPLDAQQYNMSQQQQQQQYGGQFGEQQYGAPVEASSDQGSNGDEDEEQQAALLKLLSVDDGVANADEAAGGSHVHIPPRSSSDSWQDGPTSGGLMGSPPAPYHQAPPMASAWGVPSSGGSAAYGPAAGSPVHQGGGGRVTGGAPAAAASVWGVVSGPGGVLQRQGLVAANERDFPSLSRGGRPAIGVAVDASGDEIDADDDDLQRALAASIADTGRPSSSRHPLHSDGAGNSGMNGGIDIDGGDDADEDDISSYSLLLRPMAVDSGLAGATGLVNRPGLNNCFLNVIIQCLWDCRAFRQRLAAELPPADSLPAGSDAVVRGLLALFRALEDAGEDTATAGGTLRLIVDPTELREALDSLPGHGFRLGEMNDPSEVLGAIFECLAAVTQLRSSADDGRAMVDEVFGQQLRESVRCGACGVESHRVPSHVEYFHIIQATALRNIKAAGGGANSMGELLHIAEQQQQKRCDKDAPFHGCDALNYVTKVLEVAPKIFMLQLVWETEVSGHDIFETLESIDAEVDAQAVFDRQAPPVRYRLNSMFCYYGKHYFAFVLKPKPDNPNMLQWIMFDDAHVGVIGAWTDVLLKCQRGRIQPAVLFYHALPPE